MCENNRQEGAENSPQRAEDETFMREALIEAACGDLPFGAVIVSNGAIVARGHNQGVRLNDPTAHGEMMAIRDFISRHPAEHLQSATIYTTGEPCPMCMGALLWCGISRLVFAASIPRIAAHMNQIGISCQSLADAAPFASVDIVGDVLADEALALFDKKPATSTE